MKAGWISIILAIITGGAPLAAAPGLEADGTIIQPYLACDGKVVPADGCTMERSDTKITVNFAAARDGNYRLGLAIESQEITVLAPFMPKYTVHTLGKTTVFPYPYDWTHVGQNNVLNQPRLVMPGFMAGGKIYHADTHELTAITLEPAAQGRVRALLLLHRFFNRGWDSASPDLPLRKGESRTLDVLLFDNIEAVNRERFGTTPALDMKQLTTVFYRGWTTPRFKEAEYDKIANRLRGAYDCVIIREAEEHGWIPPLFQAQGIRVMDYHYLGALRLNSAQMPQTIQEKFGLKGSDGSFYTSPEPTPPAGHWQLTDIRRPEVRALHVANAVKAVKAGFDAVFVDGYIFWRDVNGRIGGNVPAASHSLAYARWQMLQELRQAIDDANPKARLGVLGKHYYDTLGAADFILKERMYGVWEKDGFTRRFDERKVRIGQDMDVAYEDGQAPFVAKNIIYGFKGISSVCVQSAKNFLRRPRGPVYLGAEDFLPEQLDQWLDTQRAIATQDDLYIRKIEPPSVEIHFEGASAMWADAPCTIELSRPARVVMGNEKSMDSPLATLKMESQTRYRITYEP